MEHHVEADGLPTCSVAPFLVKKRPTKIGRMSA
jgi:hypothetical protein